MGDHRASVKIEMEFHGVKDSADMWINYFPEFGEGAIDRRVREFFESVYERGMAKYSEGVASDEEKRYEAEELANYERLKSKFEGP